MVLQHARHPLHPLFLFSAGLHVGDLPLDESGPEGRLLRHVPGLTPPLGRPASSLGRLIRSSWEGGFAYSDIHIETIYVHETIRRRLRNARNGASPFKTNTGANTSALKTGLQQT